MAWDQEAYKNDLKKVGEAKVRELFATGKITDSKKVPLVQEFLRQEEQSRKEASIREQMDIARSAKNAAWAAATAAIIAATCAAISIAINLSLN